MKSARHSPIYTSRHLSFHSSRFLLSSHYHQDYLSRRVGLSPGRSRISKCMATTSQTHVSTSFANSSAMETLLCVPLPHVVPTATPSRRSLRPYSCISIKASTYISSVSGALKTARRSVSLRPVYLAQRCRGVTWAWRRSTMWIIGRPISRW